MTEHGFHALVEMVLAAAIGMLIGLERERARVRSGVAEFGGVRTFPLIAVLGNLSTQLVPVVGWWLVAAGFGGVSALLVADRLRKPDDAGLTTEFAALVTFLLGTLLSTDLPATGETERYLVTVVAASGVMGLLAAKNTLHRLAQHVTGQDLVATSKFVLLALVLLPLLPDRSFGPYAAINPRDVGWMVVLVAGVSFLGYLTARILGPRRGLWATGLLGGLVSSTAVAASVSRSARDPAVDKNAVAAVVVGASSFMFGRVAVEVAVVNSPLFVQLAWPLALMTLLGLLGAGLLARRGHFVAPPPLESRLPNPFQLDVALQFGLLYALMVLLAKATATEFGDLGVITSAVVAGLADVDAITLSVARLHREGLADHTATAAIVAAMTTNTLVKIGLAGWLGGRRVGQPIGIALGLALLGGAAAVLTQLFLTSGFGG